ncbi:MAG: SPOR domain-containing protein [Woeseiaceae bacterium]|nr:SPOR domain-containing protein [Woeseiaceae bacterium]
MAGRRKKKSGPAVSPLLSMLFGLAVGLSVAVAVYMKDRGSEPVAMEPEPASLQNALDDNGETPAPASATAPERTEEKEEPRFTFYDILPNVEVVTPEKTRTRESSAPPQAVIEPGTYVLQAGSFSTHQDADKRRAELGLHGIESHIQRVKVNDRNYHRVYIGPTDDLDELNMLRSRLRAAQIDVLRIRLSD